MQGIQHLPGVIEVDALDSFKMLRSYVEVNGRCFVVYYRDQII
jgi:hypothetical protein